MDLPTFFSRMCPFPILGYWMAFYIFVPYSIRTFHVPIQEFLSKGVQARQKENRLDVFLFFFSPQLILQRGSNGFIAEKMKKVNKQCLLDTPRTVRVSEKTWQVIVRTRRP